jgi:PAS domain S-box-containing protein
MRELEERKFQKIYENIATGIALTNLDGFFEECNAAYSALTGYYEDELRKMQLFSLIHPEDLGEIKRGIEALMEGREPQFDIERRYISKSGATLWVRKIISTIPDAEKARSEHRARRRHHKPFARAASRASRPEIV